MISELSAEEFNAQHGSDLAALVELGPLEGFVNKDAGAACTSKGTI